MSSSRKTSAEQMRSALAKGDNLYNQVIDHYEKLKQEFLRYAAGEDEKKQKELEQMIIQSIVNQVETETANQLYSTENIDRISAFLLGHIGIEVKGMDTAALGNDSKVKGQIDRYNKNSSQTGKKKASETLYKILKKEVKKYEDYYLNEIGTIDKYLQEGGFSISNKENLSSVRSKYREYVTRVLKWKLQGRLDDGHVVSARDIGILAGYYLEAIENELMNDLLGENDFDIKLIAKNNEVKDIQFTMKKANASIVIDGRNYGNAFGEQVKHKQYSGAKTPSKELALTHSANLLQTVKNAMGSTNPNKSNLELYSAYILSKNQRALIEALGPTNVILRNGNNRQFYSDFITTFRKQTYRLVLYSKKGELTDELGIKSRQNFFKAPPKKTPSKEKT